MKILVAGLGGWAKADTALEAFENARQNSASVMSFKAGQPLYKMWLVADDTTVDDLGRFISPANDKPVQIGTLDKNGKLVKAPVE